MIVRNLADARVSARHVEAKNWNSTRLLLKGDGAGFSFHITTLYAGTETPIHYRNHIEAVYCISGEGEVETLDDGVVYPIRPGTMYLLDRHDNHLLRAHTQIQCACVFNPPLNGREVHDADGVYPLEAESVTG